MRLLAAFGSAIFAYLALIPAGLVYSTLDSACAGSGCETSLFSRIAFTLLYAACLLALLTTAGLFAAYAAGGRAEVLGRVPRSLAATGAVVGVVVFILFVVAFPLGGGIALAGAATGYLAVRVLQAREPDRRSRRRPPPVQTIPPGSSNGHGNGNGHRPLP